MSVESWLKLRMYVTVRYISSTYYIVVVSIVDLKEYKTSYILGYNYKYLFHHYGVRYWIQTYNFALDQLRILSPHFVSCCL
jgi:hypothetical protein